MVFQKKGANAVKNDQLKKKGKKAFEVKEEEDDDLNMFDDMDDSDDDDDSEEEETQVQKTPLNKGLKGRQSLSEKKVSFQIPGKNSPAIKTPKKDNNSLIGKKQPTPANKGKTQVQEFKGIKGNKNQVKKDEEESDDDDDDEIDEDEDDDLDVELDEEDDDDDDEEEDDDDDDDDDDEDEEEENSTKGNVQKKLTMLKQKGNEQNKQKTPLKGNDKTKNAPTPKGGQTPKSEIKAEKLSPKQKQSQTQIDELERRRQRDIKMLYVGNLPKDVTAEELKVLSSDIQEVIIPATNRKQSVRVAFAFLAFASEAKAEANHTILQSKKFRGQLLTVDFVGEKSKNKKPTQDEQQKNYNMKKLFVSGLSIEVTIAEVAEHFPMAYQISFNQSPTFRSAMIYFSSEEAANEAFQSNQEVEIRGQKLVVLHSLTGPKRKPNKRNRSSKGKNVNHGGNPAKKMKFAKKEESDDEE